MYGRSIFVADGVINIVGDLGDNHWWSALEPFTHSAQSDSLRFHLQLMLTVDLPTFQERQPRDTELKYGRHDLELVAKGDTVWGYYDGQQAGFMALLELAIYWAVERAGGCLVHAAAGVLNGEAIVMPGPSGTGKSTAARGGFQRVLSDERVAILPDSHGGFRVWGTPFWSDGRQFPMDIGSAPLGCFARLYHGETPKVERMGAGQLAAWVMRSVISYDYEPQARERALDLACTMVESCEGIAITYPKEGQWVSSTLNPIGLAS